MLILSSRHNFTDPWRPGSYAFKMHTAIAGAEPSRWIPTMEGTLLIHGYKTDADSAIANYGLIDAAIPEAKCNGLLWPGGDKVLDYPFASERATDAGKRLRDVFQICSSSAGKLLHCQTHSLGARVACASLMHPGIWIGHLILSAAAIAHDSFELGKEFVGVPSNCESVNIFFSSRDKVLAEAYPAGTFFREHAMGLLGPKSFHGNIRAFDCSRVVGEHGGYKTCPKYFKAWQSIINETAKEGLTVL